MKYQIYLNKEATNVIETLSREAQTRPATFIKYVLEQFSKETTPKLTKILEELREGAK